MRKLLLSLTLVFLSSISWASHLVGGQLSYKHISQNLYRVDLYVIYDSTGIPPTVNTQTICVENTCEPINLTNHQLPMVDLPGNQFPIGGIYIPNADLCVDDSLVTSRYYVQYFSDTIDIGTTCTDITVWWSSACCRPDNIDNLDNLSENILLFARLSNSVLPNSMPDYNMLELMRPMCKQSPVVFDPFITEEDGDSLHFSVVPAKFGSCGNMSDYGYNPGYSGQQPMTTLSGFNIDPTNGSLAFTPVKKEVSIIGILTEEYRYDSTLNQYTKVGEFMTDYVNQVLDECRKDAEDWGLVDDTLQLSCLDSTLILQFSKPVGNASIAPDATDFRVIGPNSTVIPVIGASFNTPQASSEVIALSLFQPVQDSGFYTLFIKTGNDGNSLTNVCGLDITIDTMYLYLAEPCNIGLDETPGMKGFKLYPNPVDEELHITGVSKGSDIEVLDLNGRVLMKYEKQDEESYPMTLSTVQLKKGIYLIRVKDPFGRMHLKKLLKD